MWLIQFSEKITPAQRAELRAYGVDLLRFIPDDAFVARFDSRVLAEVKTLAFVRWVGPYKPEYKIHSSLLESAANPATNRTAVRLLISPRPKSQDVVSLREALRGGRRQSASRFGSIWEIKATPAEVQTLAKSDGVLWIERAPKPRLYDEISAKIVGGNDEQPGTGSLTQQLGFDGRGVTVSVADSGLDSGDAETMHPDLAGRVDRFFFYGKLTDAADEHSHGTHVSGIIAGNGALGETDDNGFLYGLGVAPKAHLIAQRIFDGDGNFEPPPSNETLTRDAVRAGAQIGSNSWGDDTQGRYDLSAHEFDALVRDADGLAAGSQPYLLEFSAGNAGPGSQTIGSPAVAKNVIATGASENDRPDFFIYADGPETMADFSSRGPCEDGRIKPDLVAPGTWIASLQSASASDENAWLPISPNYQYEGGTSQSGPHVSGGAAVFMQYYRETHTNATPSPALVKAALINSAADMDNEIETGPVPNMDEGWGRLDLAGIIGSPRVYDYLDQTELLSTGQTYERRVVVGSSEEPLKITLVYTDVPGLPAAIPALVNDLDLEVVAPDGQIYHGNQFDEGESIPGAAAFDAINNVEAVHLAAPLAGEYLIRVHASNVAEDAREETAEIDQDFALVISGDLPLPGVGTLILDRAAYQAPDRIGIKLIDFDLKGQASAQVLLTSSTETNGEPVILNAFGSAGVFTGSLATVTGPALSDGALEISNGDRIEAAYFDASAGIIRSAAARADFTPPVIRSVTITNHLAKTEVTWETDEPARTIVYYGTNSIPTLAIFNSFLRTEHEIDLADLVPGTTYRFAIVAIDAAGNVSTNNNAGQYFTFVPAAPASILLVDAFEPDSLGIIADIPLSTYTSALDQTGVSYDIWDHLELGSPTLGDLRPYRIVIWRFSDSIGTQSTLSGAEQSAIQSYLNAGGAFFLASMEQLSRLGSTPFRTNVLHVESFAEDVGVPGIAGEENDPITAGINLELDYTPYALGDVGDLLGISDDLSDTLSVTADASPILFSTDTQGIAGVRYPQTGQDATGRVVFLSFPLETVPETGPSPNKRADLLRNVIRFLAPGLNGLAYLAFDRPAYSLPSLLTAELADSDLAGHDHVSLRFFSSTETNGILVPFSETAKAGVFRGSVALVSSNAASAGQLNVRNGDDVWADYFDASGGGAIRASARIDTQFAEITNITASAEYSEATVSWETSEATDGLVQFGESAFLGRTGYESDFTTEHEVILRGLLPDRIYYYKVTSRDPAGNTTTDDNGGRLYTFNTLRPRDLPFVDNLEGLSSTNWSVIQGDESEVQWQLGQPANGRETAAHSPTNAWGSNLDGGAIEIADTLLVGPAVNLTGGNSATLRFWQSYDFTGGDSDIYEFGQVFISTNNTADWTQIAEFAEESDGWEEAEIDLSPYLGQVVRLGWYYGLLSFEGARKPGWLIDDISITVTNIVGGTIEISNNISAATFALAGPIGRTAKGDLLVISNAPPGTYSIVFGDVPFYRTPAAQTNTLESTNTLRFNGIYTFPDTNANQVSDEWEIHYFGSLLGADPRLSDRDGDGATDYEEFIAGTNPTNSLSVLEIAPFTPLNNGLVRYSWATVPGHNYRLEISTDLIHWTPFSDWIQAASSTTSVTAPAPVNQRFYSLRVAARQ